MGYRGHAYVQYHSMKRSFQVALTVAGTLNRIASSSSNHWPISHGQRFANPLKTLAVGVPMPSFFSDFVKSPYTMWVLVWYSSGLPVGEPFTKMRRMTSEDVVPTTSNL